MNEWSQPLSPWFLFLFFSVSTQCLSHTPPSPLHKMYFIWGHFCLVDSHWGPWARLLCSPRGILRAVAGTAPGHAPWTAAPLWVFLRFPASGRTQPGMFPVSPNEVTEDRTVCCCFVLIMFLRSQAQRGSEKRNLGQKSLGKLLKKVGLNGVSWRVREQVEWQEGNRNRNTQTCVAARGRNGTWWDGTEWAEETLLEKIN